MSFSRSSVSAARSRDWRSLPLGQRTIILGVVNVTPDSFSGDGVGADPKRALDLGRRLVEAGADALDVGGESTRPGATPVSLDDELRRVVPAIAALSDAVAVPLSVDTTKLGVARAALEAGAMIVNDVSGLRADVDLAQATAEHRAALILGHWARADWGTGLSPNEDPVTTVAGRLRTGAEWAAERGMQREAIWLDPGLGFGKRPATSLALMRRLTEFAALGHTLVLGPSRKAFIGGVLGTDPTQEWEGAAALVSLAIAAGVQVVRVHDVARLARVVRMADAIVAAQSPLTEHMDRVAGDR